MNEPVKLRAVVTWKLEKFDGELPKPGENKQPVEVIEGGDGLPTIRTVMKEGGNGTD